MQTDTNFKVVIPARYSSTRYPGKPLAKICGKEMVLHVYEKAQQSSSSEVIIATDDKRIAEVAEDAGATVCMTSPDHQTGTDRLTEVVNHYGWPEDTVIVNVQGDEPLIPVSCIEQVATNLIANTRAVMATLATPITTAEEYNDPNVVKVMFDTNGMAMLFSRSGIPFYRDGEYGVPTPAYRHLGIYSYRAGYLTNVYGSLAECKPEVAEKLEQLRVLHNGDGIHVDVALDRPGPGVDTPTQLEEVESLIRDGS